MAETTQTPPLPNELPVVPLRGAVVLPMTVAPLGASRPLSVEAVNKALAGDRMVLLLLQTNDNDEPAPDELHRIGTVAIVRQMAKGQGGMRVLVEGVARARAEFLQTEKGHLTALVKALPEPSQRSLVSDDPHVPRLAARGSLGDAHGRSARSGRSPARPRRGSLRSRQGQGADRGVPGGPQAEGGHEGSHPLLRRPAWGGQDLARPVDRPRHEPEICADFAGRGPHLHRVDARTARAGAQDRGLLEPGADARRDRQGHGRRAGGSGGRAARGPGPRAEPCLSGSLPGGSDRSVHVLFIATANQLGTIHPALLDRMELIQLSSYTEEEKVHIAKCISSPGNATSTG